MEDPVLPIGELARRSGVAASAIRFYEAEGLLPSQRRGAGGRRWYARSALRRLAFIRVAQELGVPLAEVREALARLPEGRTPTPSDWQALASAWHDRLQARIDALTRLRDQLGSCIGCGCLSLKACALYNPQDAAGCSGSGPRYLLGQRPPDVGPSTGPSTGTPDEVVGAAGPDLTRRAARPRSSAGRRARPE